jgi:hypothetical protein
MMQMFAFRPCNRAARLSCTSRALHDDSQCAFRCSISDSRAATILLAQADFHSTAGTLQQQRQVESTMKMTGLMDGGTSYMLEQPCAWENLVESAFNQKLRRVQNAYSKRLLT